MQMIQYWSPQCCVVWRERLGETFWAGRQRYGTTLEFPDTHACGRKCVSVCFMCVYVCHRGYLFVSACKEESEVCVCYYICACVCVRVWVCACEHSCCWCGSLLLPSPRGHAAGEDRRGGDGWRGVGAEGGWGKWRVVEWEFKEEEEGGV